MPLVAFSLIVMSSILHATWNLLAKRASGGLAFTWLFSTLSVVIYAPLAGWFIWSNRPHIGSVGWVFFAGSTALHIAYYTFLQRGYRLGDMSLVYPLSRGLSPLLVTIVAVMFLHERLGFTSALGIGLIVLGTLLLGYSGVRRQPGARAPFVMGLLTGATIATYTLWDRHAVSVLLLPPLLYDWGCNLGRTIVLTPLALRDPAALRLTWNTVRREALGIAILSPLGYILVLTAMTLAPISYVAPVREMSILFGTLMGGRFLSEGKAGARSLAAAVMVFGITLLTLG